MKRLIILLLTVGLALSLPGIALAQKVGSFTVVQGTVDLIPTGKAAHAAKQGEPVQVGDTVRTRKEGRAEITFDDGTIVRVARSTEMQINQFLIGDKRTDAQINLPRGKIQSVVPKKVGQLFGQQEANRFEVKTPIATCGVRGTNFFTYHQNNMSGATFQEGQGYFFNNKTPDLVSMVNAGQSATITGPGGSPVVRPASDNEMKGHGADTGSGNGGSSSNDSDGDTGGGLAYTPPPPADDTPPTPPTPPVVGPINVYIPPPVPEPEPTGTPDFGVDHALAVVRVVDGDSTYYDTVLRLTPHADTTTYDYTLTGESTEIDSASTTIDLPVYNDLYHLTTTYNGTTDGPIDFVVQSYSLTGKTNVYLDNDSWDWTGDAVGGMAVAPSQDFGGWNITLTSGAEGTPNESWNLAAGGQLGNSADSGYWIMEAAGDVNSKGISALTYLTEGYLGIGFGTPTATFDGQTGHILVEDLVAGSVAHSPLAFGGGTYGSFGTFDESGSLSYYPDSGYSGLFGTTHTTLFSGTPTPVVMMGEAYLPLANPDRAVLVNGSFEGNENYSNAATSGYVAGIWRNGVFTGRVASLYLDMEGGNVGYLTGAVEGSSYLLDYYTGSAVWLALGDLTADVQLASSGLTIFSTNTSSLEGGGLVSADNMTAGGDPIINVQALEGEFLFITDPDTGLPIPEAGMVWTVAMGGTYVGPVAADWTTKMGGSGTNYFGLFEESYYWLGALDGTQWGGTADTATENDLAATATARMLSQTHLYTMAGDILGTFDPNNGTWQAAGIGTQTSVTPLAMAGIVEYGQYVDSGPGGYYAGPEYGLSADYGGYLDYYEDVYALLGTTETPWYQDTDTMWRTRPVDVVLMGEYYTNDSTEFPYLWHSVVYSHDILNGTDTTFNLGDQGAGAFGGYVAGAWRDGIINGYLATIYLDPDGNAGLLVGDLSGFYYPGNNATSMFEADGTLIPVQLATGITTTPEEFYSELRNNTNSTLTATVEGQFANGGYLGGVEMAGWQQGLPGQDWGLLMLIIDGYDGDGTGYSNPNNDTEWSATITGYALNIDSQQNFKYEAIASGNLLKTVTDGEGNIISGDINGTLAGAWVDIDRATTGVAGGKIMGSFDPANANWQAVALGVGIDTTKFLAMAVQRDAEGNPVYREKLDGEGNVVVDGEGNPVMEPVYNLDELSRNATQQQLVALNIPNIEIGRADLTGTPNDYFTEAHMNDVTFFAYRSTEAAKIWASGDVGGTIATIDSVPVNPVNQSVALSGLGGAITANLNMQTWNTVDNKWAATVTDGQATQLLKAGSPVVVDIGFQGNAAGTISGTDFGGTGSGVVTPPPIR